MRFAIVLLSLALGCTTSEGPSFEVRVVSSRPDMITGGDALVEVRGAAADSLSVRVNGQEVSAVFAPGREPERLIGMVSGLEVGENRLEAEAGGETVGLEVVNHPRQGPVFSGLHQEPFTCETEAARLGPPLDDDCSAPTRIDWFYRSTEPGEEPSAFKPFDRAGPRPEDLAQTTTTQGKTVDFIVRVETGTINRAVYQIAALQNPAQPEPDPAATDLAWNGRLVYRFGGGCAAGYRQARVPSALGAGQMLGQGYATAASSLNVFGNNCNDVLSAETMMMVKERFIETHGAPSATIGVGGSGGSMQQHLIAQNYPGLLDGIIPGASYPDIVTLIPPVTDCSLLDRAFSQSKPAWSDEEKTAVSGYATWTTCLSWMRNFSPGWLDPDHCAEDAPDGVPCAIRDNIVNLIGRDPETGRARRFLDNVGLEYGRNAFNDGLISAEQFVELNEIVGGYDADANIVPERSVADPEALDALYRRGRVNQAGGSLGAIPIIDTRRYLDPSGNIHDRIRTFVTARRLEEANGGTANRVILTNPPPALDVVRLMDRWLEAISLDAAAGETMEAIARNRPEELASACWSDEGERIPDDERADGDSRCNSLYPPHGDPRLAAGAPLANDILKCALRPVAADAYRRPLSADQIERLKAAFPQGVCDYSKPGVGQQAMEGTWLRYE